MEKNNHYTCNTESGTNRGFFKIYQSKSGFIFLQMGNGYTKLTQEQIDDLGINLYSLEDFSQDDYSIAYNLIN